jgi:translation initiation factor IF-2
VPAHPYATPSSSQAKRLTADAPGDRPVPRPGDEKTRPSGIASAAHTTPRGRGAASSRAESGHRRNDRVTPASAARAADAPNPSQRTARDSPPPSLGTVATATPVVDRSAGTAAPDVAPAAPRAPTSPRGRGPAQSSVGTTRPVAPVAPVAEAESTNGSPSPDRPGRGQPVRRTPGPPGSRPLETRPQAFTRVRPEANPEPSGSSPVPINRWPRLPDERADDDADWPDRWPALPMEERRERPDAKSPWGPIDASAADLGRHQAHLDREQRGERWNA